MTLGLCFAAALVAAGPATTAAVTEADRVTPQVATVSDVELAEQRGGFRVGALEIQLGADIRSYVGGRLAVQTTLRWTDTASSVQHVFPVEASSAVASGLAVGLVTGSGLTLNIGDEKVIYVNGGQTAFIQRTSGTIQNIVINTASNVDLRQEVDAQLDIRGFTPFRNDILAGRIGSALTSMSSLSLLMSGTR